ncbi:alpha/beta hydrolase [Microvirga pudoricolor]|uniref:alpha/beta hydrolase n=1 Tax=Microvirga pudoricolor TaxID=2778729 RepID=UPI00194E97FE|nr:alpha/beta hydrolase [Microvirga pudoricolor]MBM6595150.1 alpha/beta hydrolase [Microvirga pudoricolor]
MTPFVDPDMQVILDRMRAGPQTDFKTLPIDVARRQSDAGTIPWSEGAPAMAADELAIGSGAHRMRARLYRPGPGTIRSLILYVHGGGWTFGSIDTHDGTMRNLAAEAGLPVLGIDYRLAPEHPFPAPLDDVLAALAFVENGGLGASLQARDIALAGDSAGANLALAALLARRDSGLPMPASAALFYGCYAPDFSTASHAAFGGGDYLLTSVNMRWYWTNFLGPEGDDAASLATPVRHDLSGLPPLYLSAAGLDPLRDDTLQLAEKLAASGISFRCDHVPGVVHGCLRMTRELSAARKMIASGADFIVSHFNEKNLGGTQSWSAATS